MIKYSWSLLVFYHVQRGRGGYHSYHGHAFTTPLVNLANVFTLTKCELLLFASGHPL
jgi:hypothetical protein